MNKTLNIIGWVLQALSVLLLMESVIVKVMSTQSEVAAFTKLEMEPTGRYVSLAVEILCITGLVTPRLYRQGAVLAILLFAAGVFFHLTELNINWWNDGGLRFYLNLLGLIAAIGVLVIRNRLAAVLYRRGRLN